MPIDFKKVIYFISYAWKRPREATYNFQEEITAKHPLVWLAEIRKHEGEEYKLLWWQKVDYDIVCELYYDHDNIEIDSELSKMIEEEE